jgi:hypothetical protein
MSSNVILNNSSVSSLSVDGGSLENVTIGSSTPTTAGFTTITGTSMTLSDNLIVSDNLLVSRDTVLGTSSTNLLTINATVQGGSAGGNVWFEGNLISSSNTYSLGIATKAWSAIYAIKLVTTSDQRAKKDIEPLEYGLDELLKLNPVSYEWKDRPNPKRTIGLIAQEVSEVMDEVVVGDVKKDERIGLEYHTLVPVLIQAIKEQQGIIEAQKVDLHTQDQRANQQEARLKRLEKLIGIETPRSE